MEKNGVVRFAKSLRLIVERISYFQRFWSALFIMEVKLKRVSLWIGRSRPEGLLFLLGVFNNGVLGGSSLG